MTIAANNGQKLGPKDLLQRMNLGMYEDARERGMTLTQLLERETPSGEYKDGLDAYQRLLQQAGIVTRSHPRGAFVASRMEVWEQSPQTRALFPEWCRRTVDQVRFRQPGGGSRAPFTSVETAPGSTLRPYADDPTPRLADRTEPAIPLDEVVVRTRFTDGDLARATYLNRDVTSTRRKRVAQGAELPRSKVTTGQRNIALSKFGIAIEATYEAMRRVPLDQFAFFLALEEIQAETDKVAAALDVAVNGDGNVGTSATVYALTALDPAAVAGTLTLKGWIAYKAKFGNPYMMTHALAQEAVILQLLLLNMGTANLPLASRPDLGQLVPINGTLADGVRYGITADAPSLKIVGYDRRFALGRVVENGSQIMEMDRWITRQVSVLTISENEGYESIDSNAVKILNINA